MRNLKRVLSLALALVMVLGMMVITTSAADFTDADEITNIEAVEVLAALGIVEGSNGAFNPNGNFTREAAAKLITYMKLGPDMAEKLAGTDVFTDVAATRWSAKYIGYCANLGYITGVGNDKFNPSGVLKDIELGKLVLCALGYDAAKYTGANWATAVTVDMIDAGLVDSVTGTAISREDACAMILAGMKKGTEVTTYDVEVDGETVSFDNQNDALLYCAVAAGEKYIGKVTTTTDSLLDEVYDVTCTTGTDAFGRPATTYADGKKIDLAYADEADVVIEGAKWNANTISKTLKDYKNIDKAEVIYNGDTHQKGYDDFYNNNGVTVEIYANNKKEVSKIIVTEAYVTEVTDISYDKKTEVTTVTLEVREAGTYLTAKPNAYKTIKIDSEKNEAAYALIADYAEKDVFMGYYGQDWVNSADELLKVADVETIEGKVTSSSITGAYNGWIKIDGEKYEFANEYSQAAVATKSEGTFYLYNGYVVDFDGTAEVEKAYAYVLDTAAQNVMFGDKTYYAELLYTDGAVEAVEVSADAAKLVGKLVTYAEGTGKDSGKIVLTEVKAEDGLKAVTNGNTMYIKKNTAELGSGVANNNTIFVVGVTEKGKTTYTAYTGVTNVPGYSFKTFAGVQDNFGNWIAYFVPEATPTADTSTTAKDISFLANGSDKITELVGDKVVEYYTYDAIIDGEITTVDASKSGLEGLYGSLTYDEGLVTGTGALKGDDIAEITAGQVAGAAKNGIIKLGNTSYIYDDATIVYEVAKTGISETTIDALDEDNKAIAGYTTNGILTVLIVE